RMPDTEWIFKVLNQLPVFTIRRVLTVIHEQLSHSEFSRRNLAARLLKEIRSDVDTDKFENVRLAIISTTFNASSAT
ncbi:hypothetical protein EBR96_08175, partial [bacterium]|nr:hypothetical protein [bacterium]